MLENIYQFLLPFADTTRKIETILFGDLEDDCHGTILMKVVIIVANFLLAGIVLAGTIGIIIAGVQILTARDNVAQASKGKRRIIDTLIGIAVFGFMYVIANFLIPGGVTLDSETLSSKETCPEVAALPPAGTGTEPHTTTPGEPTSPGEPQGDCSGNMVEKDGWCYINSTIKPWDYSGTACTKYNSCQAANSSAWGSNCDKLAQLNAREMLNGWPSSPHSTSGSAPSGKLSGTINIVAQVGQDNVEYTLCNGTLSYPVKPESRGAASINRIAFKEAVKAILTELEKGKPITIQAGNKRRGIWDDHKARGRHFITIVGVTKGLSTSNVESAVIEFEDGHCINSGKAGQPEPWDQPYITIGSKQIKFQYIDAWSATLGTLGDEKARLYRYQNGWYFYTY